MSTTVTSTLTPTTHSFNEWRRNTNKTVLSVGDLSASYTTDADANTPFSSDADAKVKFTVCAITSVSWIANVITVVTTTEHNLVSNGVLKDTITLSGVVPSGYNGTYTVLQVTNDNTFTLTQGSNPGAYVSGGTVTYQTHDVKTALNDLNIRKVKRTGDSITYLNITSTNDTSDAYASLRVAGGTAIQKKLTAIGDVAFGTGLNKVTMQGSTGNTAIAGYLYAIGDFKINTTKFTVDAATGNTVSLGTLAVTGDVTVNTNKFAVLATSGNTTAAGTLTIGSDFTVNVNKFTVGGSTGNVAAAGTLSAIGDFAINTNKFTAAATTGNTVAAGTLTIGSDFTVNVNKFTVTGSNGNVSAAGALSAAGDFKINTNKFTVAAATGDTLCAGAMGVTGALSAASLTLSTVLGTLSGGTGISSFVGSAHKVMAVNAASNAWELTTLASGIGIDLTYSTGQISIAYNGAMPSSSTTDSNLKIGQNILIGSLLSGTSTHNIVIAANACEIRPGYGTSLTNLLKITTDNAGTATALTVAANGDFAINTNKLTIINSSGNLSNAGTITSGTTLNATTDLNVTNNSNLGNATSNITTISLDAVITAYRLTGNVTATSVPVTLGAVATYSSVELIIQAKRGVNVHTCHLLAINDGTNVYTTEFGAVSSAGSLATYILTKNGVNYELGVTQGAVTSTDYKITAIYSKT